MPPARRTGRQAQPPRPAWVSSALATLGVVVGAVLLWFGYPGAVAAWLFVVVAGWVAPPAMFTGKKDGSGFPTAAHGGESRAMQRYRFWADLKWHMLFPTGAFLPGWPVYASWIYGLCAAAAVWCLPHAGAGYVGLFPRHVDAVLAFVLVAQIAAARRRTAVPGDVSPGVRIDAVKAIRGATRTTVLLGSIVTVAASVTGAYLAGSWLPDPPLPVGAAQAWYVLGAIGGFGAGVAYWWVNAALAPWRILVAAREEWAPRWQMLKHDPAPFLTARDTVGNATVDTFMAPGHLGAMAYWPLVPKVAPTMGAGQRIAILSTPNTDSQGQPQPGTKHPLQFQIVYWPVDATPDVTALDADADEVRLFIQCAMVWAADATQYARPLLDEVVPLALTGGAPAPDPGDEGLDPAAAPQSSDRQAWATTWLLPDGPPVKYIRTVLGAEMAGQLGVEVLVDHRHGGGQGAVYIGGLTDGTTVFDPSTGVEENSLMALAIEDTWNGRWAEVLKQDVNPPTIEHSTYAEAQLANGKTIHRQAFVTLRGVDPMDFFGQEAKIKATLDAAPFVAVTGWASRGRVGERHPQAFTVYWSADPVPPNPDSLVPTGGRDEAAAQWVLSGRMNEAFKAARLAAPEVYEVKCLTQPKSRGHIWRMSLRLYGGVTLSDVRGASQRLRQALGSEWLRVEPAKDGCVIVAGVAPARARLANAERDRRYLASLDWEQAFLNAKVSGVGGLTPSLTEVAVLPNNEQVQVLDFDLPAGLSFADVQAATAKLETATANAFIDVRRAPDGKADRVRILACEVNPLPERVAFDFDFVDSVTTIPFATGIEGEPVLFDPLDSPHALLAGVTGAGKSVLAQNFLYGFLAHGALVYVIDPVKGGADFQFAKPYSIAFADDPFQAAGVMKAIYAEVVRRKNLNAKHGVGSYRDLPEPPLPIVVMIDEFTSLMGQSKVPPPTDDPQMARDREILIAENFARTEVGMIAGKLAREARSAGVTLLLGTQKLTAKMLDAIPGGSDLKTNLARVLLGKASFGDRASALRAFDTAPMLDGAIPKGRGLWESLTSTAVVMQTWYAPQEELAAALSRRVAPLPVDQMLDVSAFVAPEPEVDGMRIDDAPLAITPRAPASGTGDDVFTDLGEIELSLDDLELSLEDLEEAGADPSGPSEQADPSGGLDWDAATTEDADADADLVTVDEHVVWDEIEPSPWTPADSQYGWGEIDALLGFLGDFPETRAVTWTNPSLDQPSPAGPTYRTVVASLLAERGVTLLDTDPPAGPDSVEPEPTWNADPVEAKESFDWDAAEAAARANNGLIDAGDDLDWSDCDAGPAASSGLHAADPLDAVNWDVADHDQWAPASSEHGWAVIDALLAFLDEHPHVRTVTWTDPQLDADDEMGIAYRDIVDDLLDGRGVTLAPDVRHPAAVATAGHEDGGDDFGPLPKVPAHLLPDDDPFA